MRTSSRGSRGGRGHLGKTNLSEWANFRGKTRPAAGVRAAVRRAIPTRLIATLGFKLRSAVAAAANLCVVAVGTETNGSIVSPASACGIVGVKPTVGLVGRSGIIPIAASQDTAGPMTRTVRDAALLLQVLAGLDARDEVTGKIPADLATDFAAALRPEALRGARSAIARPFGFRPWMEPQLARAETGVARGRAEVIDLGEFLPLPNSQAASEVLHLEFRSASMLTRGTRARRADEVAGGFIAINDDTARSCLAFFGRSVSPRRSQRAADRKAYHDARALCERITRTEASTGVPTSIGSMRSTRLRAGPAGVGDPIYSGVSSNTGQLQRSRRWRVSRATPCRSEV